MPLTYHQCFLCVRWSLKLSHMFSSAHMVLATGKNLVRRSPASEASTSSLCTSAPRGQEAPRPLFRSMPGDVLYSVFLSRSFTSRNNKWTVALPARPAAAPLATSASTPGRQRRCGLQVAASKPRGGRRKRMPPLLQALPAQHRTVPEAEQSKATRRPVMA